MVNHTINVTPPERLQQHPLLFTTNHTDRTFFVWRLNSARPPHPGNSTILLQSEIPSGMCAKLAPWQQATIEITRRDHSRCYHQEIQSTVNQFHKHCCRSLTKITPSESLYYCLFTPHTCIFVLRAHLVRGESHKQHNTAGEVATLSSFQCGQAFSDLFLSAMCEL